MTDKKEQIARFIQREFPQTRVVVEAVGERSATVWQAVDASDLRPGGTVSGPTLMAIADVALYVAVLGEIGIVPLAVTTSLTINFLRRPAADRRVVGECRLMKVGKTLAMGEVSLFSEGDAEPVAHVVGTYTDPAGAPPLRAALRPPGAPRWRASSSARRLEVGAGGHRRRRWQRRSRSYPHRPPRVPFQRSEAFHVLDEGGEQLLVHESADGLVVLGEIASVDDEVVHAAVGLRVRMCAVRMWNSGRRSAGRGCVVEGRADLVQAWREKLRGGDARRRGTAVEAGGAAPDRRQGGRQHVPYQPVVAFLQVQLRAPRRNPGCRWYWRGGR